MTVHCLKSGQCKACCSNPSRLVSGTVVLPKNLNRSQHSMNLIQTGLHQERVFLKPRPSSRRYSRPNDHRAQDETDLPDATRTASGLRCTVRTSAKSSTSRRTWPSSTSGSSSRRSRPRTSRTSSALSTSTDEKRRRRSSSTRRSPSSGTTR